MKKIIIVGGGAAGMMAAIWAARGGARVTLLEKNEKLGKKLFITGKGRCNLTNACDVEELFCNVVTNPKFLYSSFYGFDNRQVMGFFEDLGMPVKVERGNRVFPGSDHSSDVIKALERECRRLGVDIHLHTRVKRLCIVDAVKGDSPDKAQQVKGVFLEDEDSVDDRKQVKGVMPADEDSADGRKQVKGVVPADEDSADGRKQVKGVVLADGSRLYGDAVIVAAGGISYPRTGAAGDGYVFAKECGHEVKACYPSLVPFEIRETWCKDLMGLSLKNVSVRVMQGRKKIYEDFGEMLFTHFGVSGPLIISASAYVHKYLNQPLELYIDLKPALKTEQLDERILRDFGQNQNKQFKHSLGALLPKRLIPVVIEQSGILPDKRVNEVTREERFYLARLLKGLPLTVTGIRGYDEAIITKGGVSVKQVNPSTMESKLVKGLYFAGEVLDLDALTGGFNLQIAWSTGYLAGVSAAKLEHFSTLEVFSG